MNIAIVGLGPGREDAPVFDRDWQTWAMLWDPIMRHRADVLFEMHPRPVMEEHGCFEMAADLGSEAPIYWQYPDEGRFWRYPVEDVVADIGRDWFESSVAYMLALAIHRNPRAIGMWGIHMDDCPEYVPQGPNLCWLLGLAEGRGIDVRLAEGCRLLQYAAADPRSEYRVRYGYDIGGRDGVLDR